MNPALQTTTQQAVDPVFIFILGVAVVILIGITATMVLFVIRYHRSRAPEPTSRAATNIWLEIAWTSIASALALAMFYFGWTGYLTLRTMPKDALPVTATARMWSWEFAYASGRKSDKLYVPTGKPVRVTLVSEDVLHGFYIPAFRVKQDVVPGREIDAWFMADRAGSYDLFCSVFCGVGHSAMVTTVEALSPAEFSAWLQQAGGTKPTGKLDGATLAKEKGCLGCHSLDGSKGVGPTFKGLSNKRVTVLQEGRTVTVTADDAYLRESIRTPKAKVVEGFQPIMPAFPDLSEDEVTALVEFIAGVH